MLEVVRLNEIKLRHDKMMLETGDRVLSVMSRLKNLSINTSIEEMEGTQSNLRAMMNEIQEELKQIGEDKTFLNELMSRAE